MVCKKCKSIIRKRIKSNLEAKGITRCNIATCDNMVNILDFACSECSNRYGVCEVCGYTISK